MKFDDLELAGVQEAVGNNEVAVIELGELQLALVGGGGGEVVFH